MAKTVDYALGEHVYPRGWFMVADAEQINTAPLSVRFFGQDLVIYRGESGKAYMVSAYCPHMRTHIGKNTTSFIVRQGRQIEGESIRCPYHAWRFGPDGQCDHIPYSNIIPQQARLAAYEVVERYNAISIGMIPKAALPITSFPKSQNGKIRCGSAGGSISSEKWTFIPSKWSIISATCSICCPFTPPMSARSKPNYAGTWPGRGLAAYMKS